MPRCTRWGSRLRVNRVILAVGRPLPLYPYQRTSSDPARLSGPKPEAVTGRHDVRFAEKQTSVARSSSFCGKRGLQATTSRCARALGLPQSFFSYAVARIQSATCCLNIVSAFSNQRRFSTAIAAFSRSHPAASSRSCVGRPTTSEPSYLGWISSAL